MVPADALLTPLGLQQAEAAHNKWLSEVGLTNSDIRDLTLPQVSSGIPVPTVFYSSPLTRASRTLEITWTDITLPGESHHGQLCPSHKVVVVEVRPHLQVLSPFKFIVCLCRIVVKPLECISVISVIPNPGSRRTSRCIPSKKDSPKRQAPFSL